METIIVDNNKLYQSNSKKRKIDRRYRYRSFMFLLFTFVVINSALAVNNRLGGKNDLHLSQEEISGTVLGTNTGESLPGANVLVKGTSTGTSTDMEGKFSIDAPSLQDTLIISYIGYETLEVPIAGQTELTIKLTPTAILGEEMVVVGYGVQNKESLTSAISSVSTEEITEQSSPSFGQILQGRLAGVEVTQTSNAPGQGLSVRIRGTNSLLSSGEPLYVIDGVPTNSPAGAPVINPKNIQSIDVLKDASATAIYGSRGANGVVLITTKKPSQNQVSVSVEYGVQQASKTLDLLNARDFATLANEAVTNDNQYLAPEQQYDLLYPNVSQYQDGTDWEDEMYRIASTQNYTLSFSGGSEDSQYFISGNYVDQEGLRINNGLQKGGIRINSEKNISDKFTIGENLSLSRIVENPQNKLGTGEVSRTGQGSYISLLTLAMFPTLPVTYGDGSYSNMADEPESAEFGNPVEISREVSNKLYNNYVLGNVFGKYEFTEDLVFETSLGLDLQDISQKLYLPIGLGIASGSNGESTIYQGKNTTWISESTLNYSLDFDNSNRLDILAGFSYQEVSKEYNSAQVEGYNTDYFKYNNLGAASDFQSASSNVLASNLVSYFSRLRYDRNGTYYVTGTFRVDGSSKFGSNNKYGFFPSLSAGWIVSDEPFLQNVESINYLKLRASIGVTGNQSIGEYGSYGLIEPSEYTLGNKTRVIGLGPIAVGNPDLKWEKTRQYNFGFESDLFDDRLSITADLYYKKTNNLLLNVNIPSSSGFSTSLQNIGSFENKGIELSLETTNIRRNNINWTTSFNVSSNKSNVLDIGQNDELFFTSDLFYGNVNRIVTEGESLGSVYGYVFDGLWETQAEIDNSPLQTNATPGDPKFRDLDGNNVIDSNDRKIIGNTSPDFRLGFTSNLAMGNFSLRVFLQGVFGNKIVNASKPWLLGVNGRHNTSEESLDRWTPENTNTDIPRASYTRSFTRLANSSWMLEKGSYLRIQNVRLGYDLQGIDLISNHLANANIYIDIQNLYTFTNYSGYDPDVNTNRQNNIQQGQDHASYPLPSIYSIGLNLGF